ncbi:MAG: iron ABC transporter permease [Acidimicrobiales bacterium]|nr:iron ABC transporter permease [Acidimicrobiales bacterium]
MRLRSRLALAALPAAFLGVLFLHPLVTLVRTAFGAARLGPDAGRSVPDVLGDPAVREVMWFTTWQAAVSTIVTLALGLPLAWVFARRTFPGKSVAWAALLVPFVAPTVVVGAAFLQLLGPDGPVAAAAGWVGIGGSSRTGSGLDLRFTVVAVLAAHVFFNVAVVVRTVGGVWSQLDPSLEASARVLGAGPVRAFREVTAPLLAPSLAGAAAIVFLFCFTSFGVVLLVGGPANRTIEVEIYQRVQNLDVRSAAVLAVAQLVAVSAAVLVAARLGRRSTALPLVPAGAGARPARTGGERLAVRAVLGSAAVFFGLPLVLLATRSASVGGRWTLDAWRGLDEARRGGTQFVPPLEAVAHSLRVALAATLVAVVVGVSASLAIAGRPLDPSRRGAHRRRSSPLTAWLDVALMLPLGASAVTVGLGFLVALDEPPLDLRRSWWLLPLAHALVAVPFVVRVLVPVLRAVDDRLVEAALVLGASPWRAWREVDLPLLGRAVVVAAGFAFAVSLGEFGATLFLARADAPTVTVAIDRFLSQPGALNRAQATALAVVLLACTLVVVLTAERLRDRLELRS